MNKGFKADLFYGATKTRKTSNIGMAALYVLERYGKKTRLITADPGGYEPIQTLVDAGIVEPWVIRGWPFIIETLDKATQGYWPSKPEELGSRLLTPMESFKSGDIGLVAFEGLTSFGTSMQGYLSDTGASLSQDPNFKLKVGDTTYYGGNMSYYGFIQKEVAKYVANSSMLPVEKVIWTALEAKGEEEGTKSPIYGPAIEGKKAIGKAGAWFGNMLHFEAVEKVGTKDDKTQQLNVTTDVVMYLKPHADPLTKVMFHAGTRAPFMVASELPESMPADVGALYRKLDELKVKADKWIADRMPKAAAEKV